MNKFLIASMLTGVLAVQAQAACNTSTIAATTPNENFTIDEDNGVVLDHTTGLMWKRCVEGFTGADCRSGDAMQSTFVAAVEHIDALNEGEGFAGYNDWRLPNVKELRSIVEERCARPSLNEEVFPLKNTDAADDRTTINSMTLFTSTPTSYYDSTDTFIWTVSFGTGELDRSSLQEYNYIRFFRLVRDAH
ncbi:hypothetical protein MAQ5080_01566 [Marinomonas aquimarina]|uniref:Lcl C-terminal domain-containing protein n=1 Tax=Marinomonas aquimarina TaxID=295068 RepID=A0A1A8TDF8_9GAMM|nr:DUF1566 domain-containing protein [Marinomonas aquimarina]SBS30024.1 hypothetical protein MAQ5080_01566 [Marinomonas aquimarina]